MEQHIDEFKTYVLMRRDAWEAKYRLGKKHNKIFRLSHYPNNLKYLDKTSQRLIRGLNSSNLPIRDKLMTLVIYRIVGDIRVLRRYANHKGLFTMIELERLVKHLNNRTEPLEIRYRTPIQGNRFVKGKRGDVLLAMVCDFLDKIPKDNYHRWKTSELYKQFTFWEKHYFMGEYIAYQLATDLSFINELEVRIDYIPVLPDSVRKTFKYVLGNEKASVRELKQFTEEIMDWYISQSFRDNKERIVCPHDVMQMLIGFSQYKGFVNGVARYRNFRPQGNVQIKDLVITESMYAYYRKKELHS